MSLYWQDVKSDIQKNCLVVKSNYRYLESNYAYLFIIKDWKALKFNVAKNGSKYIVLSMSRVKCIYNEKSIKLYMGENNGGTTYLALSVWEKDSFFDCLVGALCLKEFVTDEKVKALLSL